MDSSLNTFWKHLRNTPSGNVFNPWVEFDKENDQSEKSPRIRKTHLIQYLEERKNARFLLVAEALGFQGGKFSGIPMTSERILLGFMKEKGILVESIFKDFHPERSSHPDIKSNGFSEPTASIVWSSIKENKLNPFDFIFWNAFPWHPYDPVKGKLSNRTPGKDEFKEGYKALKALIRYLGKAKIIAIGNHAETHLKQLNIPTDKVRHPARGGATIFRQQLTELSSNFY